MVDSFVYLVENCLLCHPWIFWLYISGFHLIAVWNEFLLFLFLNICCILLFQIELLLFFFFFNIRFILLFQIELVLGKTANFDELMAAAQEAREMDNGEEQNWGEMSSFSRHRNGVKTVSIVLRLCFWEKTPKCWRFYSYDILFRLFHVIYLFIFNSKLILSRTR